MAAGNVLHAKEERRISAERVDQPFLYLILLYQVLKDFCILDKVFGFHLQVVLFLNLLFSVIYFWFFFHLLSLANQAYQLMKLKRSQMY